jgi:hypothetical protein
MAHLSPRLEKALRVLLVVFVLFNAVVPFSRTNAMSIDGEFGPDSEERNDGLWEVLVKGLFQTPSCATSGDLIVADGETCSLAAGEYTFNSVIIESGGTLIALGNTTLNQGVTINSSNITIEAGGRISADGTGYQGTTGNGAGPGGGKKISAGPGSGGGAGHGGIGENAGGAGGDAYGLTNNPTALGSSGGCGQGLVSCQPGGAGGGAIRLIVTNTLEINGEISADGSPSTGSLGRGGGGAGGSIFIQTSNLIGIGAIHANGGNGGTSNGGDGAGGRVAVYYNSSTLPVNSQHVFARGAFANNNNGGGPGTVYFNDLTSEEERLLISNNGNVVTTHAVQLSGTFSYGKIELLDEGTLRVAGSASTLTLESDTLISDGTGRIEFDGLVIAPEKVF